MKGSRACCKYSHPPPPLPGTTGWIMQTDPCSTQKEATEMIVGGKPEAWKARTARNPFCWINEQLKFLHHKFINPFLRLFTNWLSEAALVAVDIFLEFPVSTHAFDRPKRGTSSLRISSARVKNIFGSVLSFIYQNRRMCNNIISCLRCH